MSLGGCLMTDESEIEHQTVTIHTKRILVEVEDLAIKL